MKMIRSKDGRIITHSGKSDPFLVFDAGCGAGSLASAGFSRRRLQEVPMMIRRIVALAIAVSMAAMAASRVVAQSDPEKQPSHEDEDAAIHSRTALFSDPALVVAWNRTVNEIAFAEDQFLTFKGVRAHAMMHIAIHDSLNAVIPLYRSFAHRGTDLLAHPIAAAAQAAHDVVLSQYPNERSRLDAELASMLSQIPNGLRKRRGITLGQQCAAAILAARIDDGWDFPGTYAFSSEPGAYQTTPPWNGFVLQPGFRFAKPFGLRAPDQFRPAPQPGLETARYAEAFNEVKNAGRNDSIVRTPDQTRYAIWWMEFAEGSVNRLTRQIVTHRRTNQWRAARMFALLNMSLFDGYVANWDSKYEYNHWRPYTAIREAARDSNPDTGADSTWEPLRPAPPFPEYVSAHSTACGASFEVLKRALGDHFSFTMETTTTPPEMPRRSFRSFSAAAAECADSRVRLGWHFRYSTDRGLALGRTVARWIEENHAEFRGTSPRQ